VRESSRNRAGADTAHVPGGMNDPFHVDGRRAVDVLFESDRLADGPGSFMHVEAPR
jgi:hypothetical protein